MRQLLPFPCDPVDAAALYGDLPSARTRPAVRLNMIASIDGATAVAGVSGGLGGPADQALFAVSSAPRQMSCSSRPEPFARKHLRAVGRARGGAVMAAAAMWTIWYSRS